MDKQKIKPGNTFIAYVDDSTACVGVIVDSKPHERANALILGWFSSSRKLPNSDVFIQQKIHPFPTYETLRTENILPYKFEQEIELCKNRDDTWWKSQNPGSRTNLVAQYFQPSKRQALMCIDVARHLMSGGSIDDYCRWDRFGDKDFLQIWMTLHHFFPKKVQQPPKEWDSKGSNLRYTTGYAVDGSPSMVCSYR